MNEPFVIGIDGKIYTTQAYFSYILRRSVKKTFDLIDKRKLVPRKLFMSQADYDDILKRGSGQ